jgi:hypothetical protein
MDEGCVHHKGSTCSCTEQYKNVNPSGFKPSSYDDIPSTTVIPYCHLSAVVRGLQVLDWMIWFIDILYIQLGTTGNYTAIVVLHTLQFTVTHELGFSVFTSRILATDL